MKLTTRLTVAMVALVLLTATAVGLLTYRNIEAVALPRVLERLSLQSELLAAQLEGAVGSARTDVAGFRSAIGLNMIVRASLSADGAVDGIRPDGGALCGGACRQIELRPVPCHRRGRWRPGNRARQSLRSKRRDPRRSG